MSILALPQPTSPIVSSAIDRLDGLKKTVMQAYRELRGNVTLSCQTVGVGRATWYLWLQTDENFKAAKEEAEAELNDEIRDVLVTKAGEADMTAVIFYLKNRHPEFKQNNIINVGVQVNAVISGDKQEYGI